MRNFFRQQSPGKHFKHWGKLDAPILPCGRGGVGLGRNGNGLGGMAESLGGCMEWGGLG